MVQLNLVPVFGAYKNTSTIWRKFFTEIFVQMVKATGFFLEAREKIQGIKGVDKIFEQTRKAICIAHSY